MVRGVESRRRGYFAETSARLRYFATKMPEFMAKVEKTCQNMGCWLVGSKVSLADAAMYVFIKEFFARRRRPFDVGRGDAAAERSRPGAACCGDAGGDAAATGYPRGDAYRSWTDAGQ